MRIAEDLRQAARSLSRHRGFASMAAGILALGIGASTAIFAVVDGVLLRPLPWPASDRLVRVSEWHPGGQSPIPRPVLSNVTALRWGPTAKTVVGLGAWSSGNYSVDRGGAVHRVRGAAVSPAVFSLLRTVPLAGRLLDERDAQPGAPEVAVLTSAQAQEWFGSEAAAVGNGVRLDGKPHLVVGVTSPGFFFPDRETRFFTPYVMTPEADGSMDVFPALARLRPGSTATQAAAEGTLAARGGPRPMLADLFLGKGGPVEVRARSLQDEMTAPVRPALLALSAGVGCLLLIACANVASLLLTRGVSRSRELAVRAALGAGRAGLFRQLLAEATLLAIVGGLLGLVFAALTTHWLAALTPSEFPRVEDVAMNLRVGAFAATVALATALLAGMVPALRASKHDLVVGLRDGEGGATSSRRNRFHAGLIAAEAALCVVLLAGAGLLARSFFRLLAVDPGYDPDRVVVARLVFPEEGDEARRVTALSALLERLRGVPGVSAAGAGNMAPFVRFSALASTTLPWRGPDGQPIVARALYYSVTPGYAEALGLRLRQGRLLQAGDGAAQPKPLIVNESFARSYLQDGDAIVGRRMKGVFSSNEESASEIVGVVGDVLKDGLDGVPQPEVYVTLGRDDPGTEVSLVARTQMDPLALLPTLRSLVREMGPTLAIDAAGSLAGQVSTSVGRPRFAATVLTVLAGLSLVLAAAGLYGVLSYTVAQRRRELGIRSALGARRRDLLALVFREGMGPTVAGLAIGLLGAAWGSRLLAGLLFGTSARDGVAFLGAAVLLVVAAAMACLVPARRAAASDPAIVLRGE